MQSFRTASAAAVTALVVSAATACGTTADGEKDSSSSFDSSKSNVSQDVIERVEAAMKPIDKWSGPSKSPKVKSGITIVSIPCGKAVEGCELINSGVKEAAEQVGWTYKTIDPAADVNKQQDAIEQAVTLGADVVAMHGIQPEQMGQALAKARSEGVTLISTATGWDEKAPEQGVDYEVSQEATEQGTLLGEYLSYATNCKAKVAMLYDPSFRTVTQRYEGTIAGLKECDGNKVTATQKFNSAEIASTLGQTSQAFFQAQSDANIGWLPYDSVTNSVVSASQQAGAADLKFVSFDANRGAMNFISDGSVIANVGYPLKWMGWATVDAANRLLQGEKPPASYGLPSRLLRKDDIPAIEKVGYQGDIDYTAKFSELWETGSTDETVAPYGE